MLQEIKSGIKLGIGIAIGMLLTQLVGGVIFMLTGLLFHTVSRV